MCGAYRFIYSERDAELILSLTVLNKRRGSAIILRFLKVDGRMLFETEKKSDQFYVDMYKYIRVSLGAFL